MSEQQTDMIGEAVKPPVKKKALTDKQRIEILEARFAKLNAMLHKMSSALGLPKSILPDLDE